MVGDSIYSLDLANTVLILRQYSHDVSKQIATAHYFISLVNNVRGDSIH